MLRAKSVGRGLGLAGATILLAIGLVACGDNTTDSAATTTSPPASTAAQVAITASDYAFQIPATVLPARVPGGVVQLTLTNTGKEPHDFQLATIDGDHTQDDIVQVLSSQDNPTPEWLHGIGGVGTVAPGGPPGIAWAKLDAGKKYWFFCTESTDQNKAHAGLGMIGNFTTEGESPLTALPRPDSTVVASEYSFDIRGVKAGEQLVEFKNDGPDQLHHFVAFPIQPGKTVADVESALASNSQNQSEPPPLDFAHGVAVAVVDPGHSEVAKLTFAPGRYAFVCFLSDHAGGPPHLAKGMIKEYNVA